MCAKAWILGECAVKKEKAGPGQAPLWQEDCGPHLPCFIPPSPSGGVGQVFTGDLEGLLWLLPHPLPVSLLLPLPVSQHKARGVLPSSLRSLPGPCGYISPCPLPLTSSPIAPSAPHQPPRCPWNTPGALPPQGRCTHCALDQEC